MVSNQKNELPSAAEIISLLQRFKQDRKPSPAQKSRPMEAIVGEINRSPEIKKVSGMVNGYMERLKDDVDKTWSSKDSTPGHLTKELFARSSELHGEFVKEGGYQKNRIKHIASELVDVLYLLAKLVEIEGIKKIPPICKVASYDGEIVHFNVSVYDGSPTYALAKDIENGAIRIRNLKDPKHVHKDVYDDVPIEVRASEMLLSILILAEKLGMDMDRSWSRKLKESGTGERKTNEGYNDN